MTPAIKLAEKHAINFKVHQYTHDPQCHSYGLEAAEKLNLPVEQVFKTLVVRLDTGQLAVMILPVNQMLSLKLAAKAARAKKAIMANQIDVERSTGYILGGVSPLAQKKRLVSCIDKSAQSHQTLFVSAGRRGLEIELSPDDLCSLCHASYVTLF